MVTPAMKAMKQNRWIKVSGSACYLRSPPLAGHGITCRRAFYRDPGAHPPSTTTCGVRIAKGPGICICRKRLSDSEPAMDFHVEIQSYLPETTASASRHSPSRSGRACTLEPGSRVLCERGHRGW